MSGTVADRMARRPARFVALLAVALLAAGVFVATAAALRFDDTPCIEQGGGGIRICPGGTVDKSYSATLTSGGGCGPALPYEYRVLSGALPPGISLSSNGVFSGRPTTSGSWDFYIELSDEDPPSASWCIVAKAEQFFRIVVSPGLGITTKSLPAGASVGVPFTTPLSAMLVTNTATNPPQGTVPGSVEWSVVSGTPPPGLAIAGGALAGTPTAEGSFTFVVQAKVGGLVDTETLTLVVRQPLTIAAPKPFATAPLPTPWEVGVPFSAKLTPAGGSGTYTFALAAGSLPTGLALAADGTVAGTPRAAGVSNATLRLTDNEGRTADYAANFGVAARLKVSTLALRPGKVGRLYRARLTSTGGLLPRTWRVTSGPLPRGIRLDRKLGTLSGTPTKAGRYRVTFQVTDGLKVVAKKTLRIDVLGV